MDAFQRAVPAPEIEDESNNVLRAGSVFSDRPPLATRSQDIHDVVHHVRTSTWRLFLRAWPVESAAHSAHSSSVRSLG